jgi:hypothetical protein
VCEELACALEGGFTQGELTEAVEGVLEGSRVALSQDDVLVEYLLWQLETDRTFHDRVALEDRYRSLTPAEVQAAFRKHVAPDRLSVVRAGSFSDTTAAVAPQDGDDSAGAPHFACGAKSGQQLSAHSSTSGGVNQVSHDPSGVACAR